MYRTTTLTGVVTPLTLESQAQSPISLLLDQVEHTFQFSSGTYFADFL